MGELITIPCADGSFSGYLAKPAEPSAMAVIVVQEIFGVNPFLKIVADRYATHGITALVPDLFWRLEPGLSLDPSVEAQWNKALELYGKFDVDAGVRDIQASLAHIRSLGASKAGVTGYCLGGLLSYLAATRTDTDASVGYYGVGIDAHLGEAERIQKPLLLHIAEEDGFVPKDAQAKIRDALSANPKVEIISYPGRDHAFARSDHKEAYHEADAKRADAATLAFFETHLA